jgi:hypothetical protein
MRRMAGGDDEVVLLPSTLTVRGSTGPAGGGAQPAARA